MRYIDGTEFERAGLRFKMSLERDSDHGAPWEEEDGHGPVSEWKRHAFGQGTKPPKRAGELILVWDHGSYRTYDYQEACRIALRDGWDAPPYKTGTKRQTAARAAMADYERLRRWCDEQWSYVGIVVTLVDEEGEDMGESEALWGIESDAGDYLGEVARELADEIAARLASKAA